MKTPGNASRTSAVAAPAAGVESVIGYLLAQAAVTAGVVFEREVGAPLQLRPVEYTILSLLREQPGLSSARLAQLLAVTAPNITAWVDRLAKRGWVERKPSATDRRERELHATAEGAALAEQATRRLVAAERQAFTQLTSGERAILAELLQKLGRRDLG